MRILSALVLVVFAGCDASEGSDAGNDAPRPALDGSAGDASETPADAPSLDAGTDAPARAEPLACEVVEGGCDEIIEPTAWVPIVDRHAPGLTICLAPGTYEQLYLANLSGEPDDPITITNCEGLVVFASNGRPRGIDGINVQDVHITGAGDPSLAYGIEQHHANQGITFDERISGIEIDHVHVHDAGGIGIGVRSYPRCDGRAHRGNWVQENTSIHDTWVHDTLEEGLYIGTSHFYTAGQAYTGGCPEYLEPELHGVAILDNIVERTGRDGIQVGAATEGMVIARNVVRAWALAGINAHAGGLMINPGSVGDVYDNWLEGLDTYIDNDPSPSAPGDDAEDVSIVYQGGDAGDIDVHDNVLVETGIAFMVLGRELSPDHTTTFRENTVVFREEESFVMELYCTEGRSAASPHPISITHNIFAGHDSPGREVFRDASGIYYRIFGGGPAAGCPVDGRVYTNALGPALELPDNYYTHDVADVMFVDAAGGDYHLRAGSPAAGHGASID